MSELDVICVGSATYDIIASVPRMPGADERMLADSFVGAGGGPAATAAVALARLGASVGFCGVVGDDEAGERVRESLAREGVDVRWLRVLPTAQTAQSSIIVSGESRAIVAWPATEPSVGDVPLGASRWLHADQSGFAPVQKALRATTDARPRLSVDAGNPLPSGDLAGVDLFVPSVSSLLSRYPESADRETAIDAALRDGARAVVATDGSGGAYLPDAVRSANAVAALSCRALDGRSAIPGRDELAAFLNSHGEAAAATTVTT